MQTKKQTRLGSNPGERRSSTRVPANLITLRESHRCGASFLRGSTKMPSRISQGHTPKKTTQPDSIEKYCATTDMPTPRFCAEHTAGPRARVQAEHSYQDVQCTRKHLDAVTLECKHLSVDHHIHRLRQLKLNVSDTAPGSKRVANVRAVKKRG